MRAVSTLVVAFAVALAGAGSAVAASPSLRLVSSNPVRIGGAHFHAREQVRVTFVGRQRRVRTVTADAQGRFTVRFATLHADPCTAFFIVAKGALGSRAVLHRPSALCPPP